MPVGAEISRPAVGPRHYDERMETLIVSLVGAVIALALLYFIVLTAVTNALRQARHEDRIERIQPDKATWIGQNGRALLKRANDG